MKAPSLTLHKLALAALVVVFCMAPTPGDIGGCGQSPDLLDAPTFFSNKKSTDCSRCKECELISDTCDHACDDDYPVATAFPKGCYPLVHDGEVCLRALRHASCDDYAAFAADSSPTTASECNFCPPERAP